jgi:uncharacterized protein VirK/YbjX
MKSFISGLPSNRAALDVRAQKTHHCQASQMKDLSLLGVPKALLATASAVYPQPGMKRLKDKVKYVFRGLLTPRLTQQWFQFLSAPELAALAQNCPRILTKLQRPYLHIKMQPAMRLKALTEHYSFISERLSATALEQMCCRPGVKLAALDVEDVGKFSLWISFWNKFEKEGELTVGLMDEDKNAFLFALAFSVWKSAPGAREIFIGGLQGFKKFNQRENVVAITREMHGLRPKGFLLFALQQIAAAWGVTAIRATSNDLNVYNDFRLRQKKVLADFDEFWIESGGQIAADGLFSLPPVFVERPLTDIKPNKRSLYRQRYQMLADLGAQISGNIRQLDKDMVS